MKKSVKLITGQTDRLRRDFEAEERKDNEWARIKLSVKREKEAIIMEIQDQWVTAKHIKHSTR